ncbi:hypothetical protein [Qipengyuania aquimaris]|uniref:Acetoacetate decarboxylase n=1 Tax=Qipengyuania aquimaris TaxID=255984 RepID=A0A9Q3XCX0_9SPHN|nr:hypothetical protein [Qipengyuania aquimaris]MBY6218452.1 hypothetical protein [Qipengyuania aquimaris]
MNGAHGQIPYTQSTASLDVPPPYHFPGVNVNTFIWEMDVSLIKHYCDTYLNIGTPEERGYTYRPAVFWPYATLLVLQYPVMISAAVGTDMPHEVPYCDRGVISQTEVFIALPVVRYGRGPLGLLTESALEWALPFIVVGNPMSCVCGREMLGLGKLLAGIECGQSTYPRSFRTHMTLPGWANDKPDTMQENLTILDIKTGPTLPTFRKHSPSVESLATALSSRDMGWLMGQMQSVSNMIDQASMEMIPTEMRTIGLKQYRDAADPNRAVYQALTSCRSHYSNIRNFEFYDEKDVTIEFNDEGSFHELLNLFFRLPKEPTGEKIRVDAQAAFKFEADIDFDQMRIIRNVPIQDRFGHYVTEGSEDLASPWFRPWRGFFSGRKGR